MKEVRIHGALGDIIGMLPVVEQIPEPCDILLPGYALSSGIGKLFECLPNVHRAREGDTDRGDIEPWGWCYEEPIHHRYARQANVAEPRLVCKHLNIPKTEPVNKILLHMRSSGMDRTIPSEIVKLPWPLPVVLSGSPGQHIEIGAEIWEGGFYQTAILMQSCRLSVVAHSSHMWLANVLGVKQITVFFDEAQPKYWCTNGTALIKPTEAELRKAVQEMLGYNVSDPAAKV